MIELDIIIKVIEILSRNSECRLRYKSEIENFQNRECQARSNKYRLGVIGVTSSGKSTMINSLLGEFLLPAVARPSSSQLVSCFKSSNRQAEVFFNNGKSKIYAGRELDQNIIAKYGDERYNQNNKESVKQIELSTPEFPFDENVILIDSPGLDAYGYAGHEQLTMNSMLPTIDFCIFVTTCKTNSDDKMLNVLNTIAEYEKPVIIVQNMIDSLKPSLDGTKSISDVAQDHMRRIERIVTRSNIKDKSKVRIVQISAINALKARQNKLRNEKDIELLDSSNYQKLVSAVISTFNQIRPIVENHRMYFLKKEISRIANTAIQAGSMANMPVYRFEYEGIDDNYKTNKKTCEKTLNEKLKVLQDKLNELDIKFSFKQSDIDNIRTAYDSCETEICRIMKSLNTSIVKICEKLNVDSRNIITDFRFEKPELRIKKKQEVVKSGYWKEGKRLWYTLWIVKTPDEWIETSYTREVTDNAGTKQNAIKFINVSLGVFKQTIERWKKSLEATEIKLYAEIANRRREYEASKSKILESQVYLQIGTQLRNLADSIHTVQGGTSNIGTSKTDVKSTTLYNIQTSKEIASLYRLSDLLRVNLQHLIIQSIVSEANKNYVIGWDNDCESRFLLYAFNVNLNSNKIQSDENQLNSNLCLIHKPKTTKTNILVKKNIFVLVNSTQFGAAMSEIAKLKLSNLISKYDKLFFVIQDFQEVINGCSISESFDNISKSDFKNLFGNYPYRVLILHDNPVFNLAAVEAQTTGCQKQYDEIRIINEIQKRFGYLLPSNKIERNNYESIIRTIIQKLGNI